MSNDVKASPVEELVMVTPVFGQKALRAWIEFDGVKYIGMGSVATYDREGKLLDFKIEPTGLVALSSLICYAIDVF